MESRNVTRGMALPTVSANPSFSEILCLFLDADDAAAPIVEGCQRAHCGGSADVDGTQESVAKARLSAIT